MDIVKAASCLRTQLIVLDTAQKQRDLLDPSISTLHQESLMSDLTDNTARSLQVSLRLSVHEGVQHVYQQILDKQWTKVQSTARSIVSDLQQTDYQPSPEPARAIFNTDRTASTWSRYYWDSSIEEVLIAKKYLEYILAKFHETETYLHSLDIGILKSVSESTRHHRRTFHESIHSSSVIWNNATDLGQNQPRWLKYRSFKQLEKYTSLLHRIQHLQFQIDSMDKMAEQTLPLLQSLNPTSSDFIQVLRCSYSMLSTDPNRVPVIVHDTIQDDAENQDTNIT